MFLKIYRKKNKEKEEDSSKEKHTHKRTKERKKKGYKWKKNNKKKKVDLKRIFYFSEVFEWVHRYIEDTVDKECVEDDITYFLKYF